MKPTRVSYSAISTWESCPKSYRYSYVEGLPSPSGPAAARGSRLHAAVEKYLKGKLPEEKLPIDFWRIRNQLSTFKALKARAEEEWNVTANWRVCKPSDPKIWLKAIIDIHYVVSQTLHVVDLKTGQIYQEHVDQLQIYAILGMVKYPKVTQVCVSGLYADQGRTDHEAVYKRKMLPHLQSHWSERGEAVLKDKLYVAKPSMDNCKWCPYNQKKGGPCQEGV